MINSYLLFIIINISLISLIINIYFLYKHIILYLKFLRICNKDNFYKVIMLVYITLYIITIFIPFIFLNHIVFYILWNDSYNRIIELKKEEKYNVIN